MITLLLFGFLIGMRHALEADHVAAVASLTTKAHSTKDAIKQGAVWGLGHTLTLFIVGSIVLMLDSVMPESLASVLEFIVGIMLFALGVDVLRRMHKERVHFHLHSHKNGHVHFHAHSHKHDAVHDTDNHVHAHDNSFPYRALFVGLMHGLAGSAALILLTLNNVSSLLQGIAYIVLFGIGSIVGMAVLSIVIAIPLQYSAKKVTWLHNALQATVGIATITVGSLLMYDVGLIQDILNKFS